MIKLSEITEEETKDYCIEIYVQSDYCDKDRLKIIGAKWDTVDKQWYFRYNLNRYNNDLWADTFEFYPDHVSIVKWNDKIKSFLPIQMTLKERVALCDEAQGRWTVYLLKSK